MIRRSTQPPQRFDRTGLLAVDPRAFFELFMVPASRATQRVGAVEVLEVSGPLVQRDEMWCDSYESIRARFTAALASDCQAIVLRFDSPGGDASGCFETARAIREEALAAGKPVYAYVDKACSAAYALASAATHGIAIGETCCAGSIGVLSSRADVTAMNTQRGLRYAFTVSGARKLDGNPDSPITDAELAETQRHVDALAAKFFGLLEDMRAPLTAAAVASFDGAVFYGEDAVANGLADAVLTFDETLARASTGDNMTVQLKSEYDAARDALAKIAKGGDANAAAAKRALAALAESEPPKEDEPKEDGEPKEAEPDGDEPKSEDEPADDDDAKAMDDDEPPADRKPKSADAGAGAQATATATEISLAEKVQRLEAKQAADEDARVRRRLLAQRPDFAAEVRAVLAKAPIATLREAVKTWPKSTAKATPPKPKAITTVAAARGESQTDMPVPGGAGGASRHSSDADELDARMGFTTNKLGCRREGSALVFGILPAAKSGNA